MPAGYDPGTDRLVAGATGALTAVLASAVCGALHVRLVTLGIAACGLTGAALWWVLRLLFRPLPKGP